MAQHNLPKQLTPFIGREQAIAEIETRLQEADCRLLTLFGLGGIGKTRLAIRLGERQLSNFSDGVWFVRLQPVDSTDWIVPTVAEALHLSSGPEDPLQTLLSYLSDKELLLMLDNYEHLIDESGLSLLTDIVRTAPLVKLVVTSREALNIQEEWRYSVSGLSMPSSEILSSNELDVHEATRLFTSCARKVKPGLDLADEYADVVKICRLVDGLPLAIEMAASWLGSLSCKAIADRIEQGHLDTRLRNVPERHRSMATVFEESWTLLSENERDILSRLSVFAGGFLWEAAHYITGSSSETLAVLVDKSLLQRHGSDRYYIHELTRQFAAQKLGQHSDHLELTLDRHCDYYASFLLERERAFRVEQSPEILRELAQEIENIRMMWKRAIDRNKIEQIQGVVRFLAEYYDFRRWYQEGVRLLEQLIHLLRKKPLTENAHRRILGMALAGRGNLLHNLGEINRAEESLREALAILRPIKASQEIAHALGHLNRLLMVIGKFREAETFFEECIILARESNDNVTLGYALFNLISINTILGKYRKAQKVAQETNACFQNINHQLGQGMVDSVQGQINYELGQYEIAKQLVQSGLNKLETLNSQWHLSLAYGFIGEIEDAIGSHRVSERYLQQSLEMATDIGDPRVLAIAMIKWSDFCCRHEAYEEAYQHYQHALNLAISGSFYWQKALCLHGLGQVACFRRDFVEARQYFLDFQLLCEQIGWRLGIVRSLSALGRLAIYDSDFSKAHRYLYEALLLGQELGVIPDTLQVLFVIAELLHLQGNTAQAIGLLTFIYHNPSCHAVTKAQINARLYKLGQTVPSEEFTSSMDYGKTVELDGIIRNLTLTLSVGQMQALAASNRTLVDPLTQRELNVLELILEGSTNREIAGQLHISVNTVKKHINHIFGKLEVKTRGQAIAKAHHLKLFS